MATHFFSLILVSYCLLVLLFIILFIYKYLNISFFLQNILIVQVVTKAGKSLIFGELSETSFSVIFITIHFFFFFVFHKLKIVSFFTFLVRFYFSVFQKFLFRVLGVHFSCFSSFFFVFQ